MEKSNQGGSNRDNTTSRQSGDEQRSSHSEKGKSGVRSQGAQGQNGKDDMSKGKKNNQREGSDRSRSASGDKK